MAAWNEIHHIGVNDLLFALGLRGGDTSWATKGRARSAGRTPRERGDGLDDGDVGGEGGGEGDRVLQLCKAESCLVRRQELEAALLKRAELQEALTKIKRKRAAAFARTVAAELARDDKVEELQDIESVTCDGESTHTSLKASLSSAKARYAALEAAVHCLTVERSRQRREELRESMPAHMRQGLPSSLTDASEGINFSCPNLCSRIPETVFVIMEDGMPGGRLETRERFEGGEQGGRGEMNGLRVSTSSPGFHPGGLAVLPNTPPRCLRGRKKFPPLQLTVNPIQSGGDVGGVSTLDEDKIMSRREKQRARLQKRASEWWRAGGGVDQDNDHQPRDVDAAAADGDRRQIAWTSPSKQRVVPPGLLPSSVSPAPLLRRTGSVSTV